MSQVRRWFCGNRFTWRRVFLDVFVGEGEHDVLGLCRLDPSCVLGSIPARELPHAVKAAEK